MLEKRQDIEKDEGNIYHNYGTPIKKREGNLGQLSDHKDGRGFQKLEGF